MAELAELAQEKGVVESSVSPMQSAYAAEALDIDAVGSEGVPVLAADDETADDIDIPAKEDDDATAVEPSD